MKELKIDKKRTFLFIAGLLICSFGDSMNFKAAIGVTPYEAVQQTANYITGIKLGTLAIICNFILVFGQVLLKRKFTSNIVMQIPLCVVQGWLFNVIIYIFFGNLELTYPFRVLFLLGGILLAAIGVGMMVVSDITVFPLEGFCHALADTLKRDFAKIRQVADILFVILCLLVSFIFRYPYAIREGTIIATLLFAPLMNLTMKKLR